MDSLGVGTSEEYSNEYIMLGESFTVTSYRERVVSWTIGDLWAHLSRKTQNSRCNVPRNLGHDKASKWPARGEKPLSQTLACLRITQRALLK